MDTPVPSALYDQHIKLITPDRLVPFAGYLMPLWYDSIANEHHAVRQAAGLFDCTHMGVLDIQGPQALDFLNAVTTNDVARLSPGKAQYSFILGEKSGQPQDDIIVYQRSPNRYLVVVNAANEAKIKDYLPQWLNDYQAEITDLRSPAAGDQQRVDIALQGPRSGDILSRLADSSLATQIQSLKPFRFIESAIDNHPVMISCTGYTGSEIGYELLVHPQHASWWWQTLLDTGSELGLKPCGLGARDSLRIEAGFPLYGHELQGPHRITPDQVGYPWAVKFDKGDFLGKTPLAQRWQQTGMQIYRIAFPGQKGIRPLRPDDAVLNSNGLAVGWITSSAKVDDQQIALAYAQDKAFNQGDSVGLYYLARNDRHIKQGRLPRVDKGIPLQSDLTGSILPRFARF